MSSRRKASSQKVTTYSVGMHLVLCNSPIDSITRVDVKEKVLISTPITTTTDVTVDASELLGGLSREGGIKGVMSFLFGYPSQAVNPYLSSVLGNIPAYRGVVSVILNHVYIGTSYYLNTWRFLCTRVNQREKGAAQWQSAYASPYSPYSVLINAVHVIRECLTDTEWGLGIAEYNISEDSFLAAAIVPT